MALQSMDLLYSKNRKKILFFVLILLMGCVTLFYWNKKTTVSTSIYDELNTAHLSNDRGQIFDSSNVRGKPFLLHFWAAWCSSCEEETPVLIQFAKDYDSVRAPLTIVAVSLDPNWEAAKKVLPATPPSPHWMNVLDPEQKFANATGSYQFPETYVFDTDGKIKMKWIGAQTWTNSEWNKGLLDWFHGKP